MAETLDTVGASRAAPSQRERPVAPARRRRRPSARVREVLRRRQVLRLLISRDLKVKYERSLLGYLWSMLEPLLLTSIYYFVFTRIVPSRIDNYPLFLVSVLLPWLWVNATITDATRALTSQSKLLTTMNLPREVFPLAVVGGKAVEFAASVPVLVLFAAVAGVGPSRYVLALPLALLLQLVLLAGISFFLASVNTLLRDVQRVIRVALRALFYLSPVVYALDRVPRGFRTLYEINPLVGIFQLHRAVWFPAEFPSWGLVGVSAAGSVVIFVVGWATFIRLEPAILKEL